MPQSQLHTLTIWILDKSGIQMVQICLVVKWSGLRMVVWKPDKNVCFMFKNVRFSNGPPNHVINHLKMDKRSVWKVKCSYFRFLVFRWLGKQLTYWISDTFKAVKIFKNWKLIIMIFEVLSLAENLNLLKRANIFCRCLRLSTWNWI